MIREAFETVPGARWIPRDSLPKDHYMFSREKIASGVPEFEELRWLNWHVGEPEQEQTSCRAEGANCKIEERISRLLQPSISPTRRGCYEAVQRKFIASTRELFCASFTHSLTHAI